jgi:hypothetical protein
MRLASAITLGCAILLSWPVEAQTTYGLMVGRSLVGGGDSRTIVDMNGTPVTGAGQAGSHFRGMIDFPMSGSSVSFRAEVFYNRLSSNANTYSAVQGETAKSALTDRTIGITASFVARANRKARLTPYFALGAGVFGSRLGSNPDPQGGNVTMTRGGMGLGLTVGAGLEWSMGATSVLFDWRYYQGLYNTRGSSFMPLSLGFKLPL